MTENDGEDPELAEIRARRARALLSEHARSSAAVVAPPKPTPLTRSSFPSFLAEHSRAVVDVWAPWCGPCRAMAPVLDSLARELAGEVSFGKLNADEEPALAARWNVEGIPTLLVFERGQLVDRVVGALPHDALAGRLRASYRLREMMPSEAEQ
ncbi:MAG: thioredoxin [Thermoplasmata archaeon]